ncbi:MAG: arabinogalactan endo-1,4-beta-galactosidase [Chitinophagaceae bacterium]|nr:arabinogalactan endo-1,4-beta-galactosidase [Chitinophagaceae bacterium]
MKLRKDILFANFCTLQLLTVLFHMSTKVISALVCILFFVKWSPAQIKNRFYKWNEFVMGADLSYVNEIEDAGGIYKVNGVQKDPFEIMKSIGVNTVRVRLWHTPSWKQKLNNGKMYSNLQDVEKTIRRAKAKGMAVNLDLHYSDTWADPDHQPTPAAWASLSFETLKDSVYQYTLNVLKYYKSRNLVPEMIQIGNENNNGMLWPLGKTDSEEGWMRFAALLNSGIRAVKDFSKTSAIKPQIIIHVAQMQDAGNWLQHLTAKGVSDYNIIGLSHYYKWSAYSTLEQVGRKIDSLQTMYQKKVMIVETAFPFTKNNADGYHNILGMETTVENKYDATEKGQQQYLYDLIKQLMKHKGTGIMYWEPAWVSSPMKDQWGSGSAWENAAWFDFNGNLLTGINFFKKSFEQ